MEFTQIIMILGFIFACYSVVGNDVIQTLGTFLSSNNTRPWYVLWGFAALIMSTVLIYGFFFNGGDMSYGRLDQIPYPETIYWWYMLPPLVLLLITRVGIPVSTTFLILSIFSTGKTIQGMVVKSITGYAVAIGAAFLIYVLISNWVEKRFIDTEEDENDVKWLVAQWASTGFLWSQWLIQDLANIYVYFPRKEELTVGAFFLSLALLLGLLAYIFYQGGGSIQKIVTSKTNVQDIRSATIINLFYGIILLIFKEWNNLPMSTTWVFIGLLAGRELAMTFRLKHRNQAGMWRVLLLDLGKTVAGLVVSVILVVGIRYLAGETF